MVETKSLGLLRDPATNDEIVLLGEEGHDIRIRHKPRVPVLDVPGRSGDEVQFLGRKSRVPTINRGVVDGLATSPLKINPVLVGGIQIVAGASVELGVDVELTASSTTTVELELEA